MSLKEAFNALDATKINDSVLRVSNGYFTSIYDFTQRIMYSGNGSIPFSQMDRETLIEARDRLVALEGKPPELPPEAPATQAPVKKFNL